MSARPMPPKPAPLSRVNTQTRRMSMLSNRLRKKRDGTPEKSLTPSQEPDESLTPTKNVIWNEEIQKLQIKQEDLPKAWPPRPPSEEKPQSPPPVKVNVKKTKKPSDEDIPKSRLVSVAKPAPPDAPVKPPDYSGYAGPRYDETGHVIMHSLLGTYEDFHREAMRRGDLPSDIPPPDAGSNMSQVPSVKYEKKKPSRAVRLHQDENNALRNWQLRMLERKRQQGYISSLLQKAPEDLAMNQADNFRSVQEKRYMIDRTIPKVDYGKGYRVGSEFWHQQEQFGDDLTGLHMTLTQSQRGYPPPVERIGLSAVVREEKGSEWMGRQTPHLNYPWHKSEFLDKRQHQLQPFMEELAPFKPDFENLQVLGSNAPYFRTVVDEKQDASKSDDEEDDGQDVEEETGLGLGLKEGEEEMEESKLVEDKDDAGDQEKPMFGPSLLFGGQRACWLGDSFSRKDEVGIEARVTFECLTGDRITSFLQLGNNGTTSIYYDWKKMSKENPFDLIQAQSQRFYFNNSSGVILPGETINFPFVFKSPNAGVFTEQWKLETRPAVCSGAALLVTLRGVAIQEDKFKQQREQLEKELVQRQAQQVVHHLLYELVNGIRTPERARSPVDAYITEEEIFQRNNPRLVYSHEIVSQLKDLHAQLFSEEERTVNIWSLSIQDLQDAILGMEEEDDEKKENLLHQMNEMVGKLSYIPHVPLQQRLNSAGHQLFVEAIDRIVGNSMLLRQQMGLPDREQDEVDGGDARIGHLSRSSTDYIRDDISTPKSVDSSSNEGDLSSCSLPDDSDSESDSRKGTRAPDKAKQEAAKDKGKPGPKDAKAAKGKEAKSDPKGKTTPGPGKKSSTPSAKPSPAPPSTAPSTTTGAAPTATEREGGESSSSHPSSPEPPVVGMSDVDLAAAEKVYRENFSSQVYEILGDMADQMDQVFSALIDAQKAV